MLTEIIKKLRKMKIISMTNLNVLSFLTLSCFCILSPTTHGSQGRSSQARHISFLVSPDGHHLSYVIPDYNQNAEPMNRLMVCRADGTEQREVAVVPADDDKFLSAGFDELLWWGNDRLICSYRGALRYNVISLDATKRAARAFYEIEKKHGRKILGAALNQALGQRSSGKELMPLVVRSLQELTADTTAGDWIPKEVFVPEIKWNVKDRQVSDDFFSDTRILTDQPEPKVFMSLMTRALHAHIRERGFLTRM